MLTDKLNTRREHESGTFLEDEWSDLVSDETLLEHLIFFARMSMHEMSQMFWIHGSESFLWTILFRVSVQIFTIYNPRTLLRASILNSGYYIWFTCRQMEKHSEIRIGTYNEGCRKVKLTYFWGKRGKSNNGSAFQILMWSECQIHFMFVIPFLFQRFKSWTLMIGSRLINQIRIRVLRSDPGDQANIKDT